MKPPPFEYARPRSLAEAVEVLAAAGEDAKVLGGGQSLVPMLNFRLARPSVLVDVQRLPELQGFARRNGELDIGAAVRQLDAERAAEVARACPLVHCTFRHIGHVQTRSRGTVGGSIAHADPAAELPAAALALDARVVVESVRGARTIPAAELFAGPFWTTLAGDEIVTRVLVPIHEGMRATCFEYARRAGDFALAGVVAGAMPGAERGSAGSVRLAAFGVGPVPVRLSAAEQVLGGRAADDALIGEAADRAAEAVDPPADPQASADYRRRLVRVLTARALEEVMSG